MQQSFWGDLKQQQLNQALAVALPRGGQEGLRTHLLAAKLGTQSQVPHPFASACLVPSIFT